MQKKLLLLTVMGCSILMNANDDIGDLIKEYAEAFNAGGSAAVDAVYNKQQNAISNQRTADRSHQCNGRHFSQPDNNSIAGRAHEEIEQQYNNKCTVNKNLYEQYKSNFKFDDELERKIYIMNELYLRGLEKCGKDKACLLKNDNLKWEEISSPGFIEQQCSMLYDPVLYEGRVILTKEQKDQLTENDPKIKELKMKLDKVTQAVQNKIDLLNK